MLYPPSPHSNYEGRSIIALEQGFKVKVKKPNPAFGNRTDLQGATFESITLHSAGSCFRIVWNRHFYRLSGLSGLELGQLITRHHPFTFYRAYTGLVWVDDIHCDCRCKARSSTCNRLPFEAPPTWFERVAELTSTTHSYSHQVV